MFSVKDINELRKAGDAFGYKLALDVSFRGFFKKNTDKIGRFFSAVLTGRQISYED